MNHIFTHKESVWSLSKVGPISDALPTALQAIAQSRGYTGTATRWELEDTVLAAGGFAWDIGAEADALHAEIARLKSEQEAADASARAQAELDRIAAEAAYVPRAISNADLRRGLVAAGINPQLITDYLNQMPEGQAKWTALADWEYSNYVERAHPMLDQLAPSFDMTAADIDAIFKSKPEYPMIGP
jgi:hypothetical protein